MKILHITDFHIDDPDGTEENLRKAHFRPFLNELWDSIKNHGHDDIDLIFATGDFINRGKVEHFPFASAILEYLIEIANLSNNKLFTSIGNHDYDIAEDTHDAKKARAKYYEFVTNKNFGGNTIYADDFTRIFLDTDTDSWIVDLDSTMGSKGENRPSKLSDKEIDLIYSNIEKYVPKEKNLFVLSHYPMDMPSKSAFVEEEDNWPEKHLWKSGVKIFHKLKALRLQSRAITAFFHGDGHSPDFWSYPPYCHLFLTGMIGGKHEPSYFSSGVKRVYNKVTEFKIIEIRNPLECIIHSFQYQNDGFEFSIHNGNWKHNWSNIRPVTFDRASEKDLKTTPTISDVKEAIPESVKFQHFTVLSDSIESEIIDEVASKRLYTFGRFITNRELTALGWVDIDALLNNRAIFTRCIDKIRDNIKTRMPSTEDRSKRLLFIGLDFWGACMAVQSAIVVGCRSLCIATRFQGRFNVEEEKLDSLLSNDHISSELIVVFTDVVSTGISLQQVANTITERCDDHIPTLMAVCIISDGLANRSASLNEYQSLFTFCSKLRIPTIETGRLPNPDILPPFRDIT